MTYTENNYFSFSFSGRVELLKFVYFYAQKSITKAGNNKFQDLIYVPRIDDGNSKIQISIVWVILISV